MEVGLLDKHRCALTSSENIKELIDMVAEDSDTPGIRALAFTEACRQCFPPGYPVIANAPPEEMEEELDQCMPADAARDDISSSASS